MLTAVKPNKHCPIDVGILLSEYFKSTFLMLSFFVCVYRDASFGNCTYNLTILDCLQGIRKVITILLAGVITVVQKSEKGIMSLSLFVVGRRAGRP